MTAGAARQGATMNFTTSWEAGLAAGQRLMTIFPPADLLALGLCFLLWLFHGWLVDYSRWSRLSLTASVTEHRMRWMLRLCQRDQRIFDGALIGNLMHSISFLASATILILGGIVALLGSADRFYETVHEMPFMVPATKEQLVLKLLSIGLLFVYSFLKFTWALRQFNYCCILVGSAPMHDSLIEDQRSFAKQAARVNELGARSFNQGLRGYYFALGGVCWFIHPAALVGATLLVVAILWRREFHSRTRRAMRG